MEATQDLERQIVRVESTRQAHAHGVPTAAAVPTMPAGRSPPEPESALPVREFATAAISVHAWTPRLAENLGLTLGRLHRVSAQHSSTRRPIPRGHCGGTATPGAPW